jgi:hypothetical protein
MKIVGNGYKPLPIPVYCGVKVPSMFFVDAQNTKKVINQNLVRIQTHLKNLEKKPTQDEATSKIREGLLSQKKEALAILENYDTYNQISSQNILLDGRIPDDVECRKILSKYLARTNQLKRQPVPH